MAMIGQGKAAKRGRSSLGSASKDPCQGKALPSKNDFFFFVFLVSSPPPLNGSAHRTLQSITLSITSAKANLFTWPAVAAAAGVIERRQWTGARRLGVLVACVCVIAMKVSFTHRLNSTLRLRATSKKSTVISTRISGRCPTYTSRLPG